MGVEKGVRQCDPKAPGLCWVNNTRARWCASPVARRGLGPLRFIERSVEVYMHHRSTEDVSQRFDLGADPDRLDYNVEGGVFGGEGI